MATVASSVGTGGNLNVFSFDAPVVSGVFLNGPHTGGEYRLSVTGLDFGNMDLTATAAFSAQFAGSSSWTSLTSLVTTLFTVTSGWTDGYPGTGTYTIASSVGTGMRVFSFDAPVVSSLLLNGPTTGSFSVTMHGVNFAIADFTGTLSLSGGQCRTSSWVSLTNFRCLTAAYTDYPGYAQLLLVSSMGTGTAVFSFDAAIVTTVMLNSPLSGGTSITLHGLNFGLNDYSSTVSTSSNACTTSRWSSTTSLQCVSNSQYDYPGYMQVTVASFTGTSGAFVTGTPTFTFNAPVLSGVYLNAPESGGSLLTVAGLNFGVHDFSATGRLGIATGTTAWTSATSVTLNTGRCEGMSCHTEYPGYVQLTLASVAATGESLFSFDAPVLTAVMLNAPATGGASLTMLGLNFGHWEYSPSADLDGVVCQTGSWTSATALSCFSGQPD